MRAGPGPGQAVEFDITTGNNGKKQAVNVRKL
jgi:uncharacterized repeat protein (TIGR01451 family)